MFANRSIWPLLVAPPARRGALALLDWPLYWLALVLNTLFLYSVLEAKGPLLAGSGLVAVAVLALRGNRIWLRWPAWALLILSHLFFVYALTSLSLLLSWSTSIPQRLMVGALALLALTSLALQIRSRRQNNGTPESGASRFFPMFPISLPMGLLSTFCLLGWHAEDGLVRCDDYLRAVQQEGVSIVVPSSREMLACSPGRQLLLKRYPRRTWEDESGERLIITTQAGIRQPDDSLPWVADPIDGSICEARLGEPPHHCVASGKAQPILEVGDPERLFVLSWGHLKESGGKGRIFRIPKAAPLEILDETILVGSFGEGFYDSKSDFFHLFSDECDETLRLHYSERKFEDPLPLPVCPGETRYNQERQIGAFCSGSGPILPIDGLANMAVAYRGNPFSYWHLAPANRYPLVWLSMTWGCDINYESEIVYVSSATLGLMYRIDFESGDVLGTFRIPLGIRNVLYDPERDWLFMTDFLRGNLLAVDAKTGKQRGRWFVGRFLRGAEHTRSGNDILVTSNLGVVKVSPPPP